MLSRLTIELECTAARYQAMGLQMIELVSLEDFECDAGQSECAVCHERTIVVAAPSRRIHHVKKARRMPAANSSCLLVLVGVPAEGLVVSRPEARIPVESFVNSTPTCGYTDRYV